MHYCANCGQPVDGAKFCPSCGTAVAAADEATAADTGVIPGIDDLRVGRSATGTTAANEVPPPPVVAAVPPPPTATRSGPSRTFLLVAVIALAVILAGVIGYLFTGTTNQQARTAATPSTIPITTPTPTPPKPAVTVTKAAPQPTVTVTQAVPVVPQNDGNNNGGGNSNVEGTDCGSGVSAAGPTSCQFALAVRNAFVYSGRASYLPSVYSPVTGQTYDMYCDTGSYPIRCTGGNDAVVLIY